MLPKEWRDTAKWPRPPAQAIARRKEQYDRRVRAIEAYVRGDPLKDIYQDENIDSATLYELFEACVRPELDGTIRGFRALILYSRRKSYERKTAVKNDVIAAGRGVSGLFRSLLAEHPDLQRFIDNQASKYRGVEWEKRRLPVAKEHGKFLTQLAKEASETSYPFTVVNKGREGYRRALHDAINRHRSQLAVSIHQSIWRDFLPQTSEIFRRVQIDAHRLDKAVPVKFIGRKGRFRIKAIRLWLLVAHERDSTATLGWHLSVGAEPSELDILHCLYNMMNPWEPRTSFEIEGLGYLPGEGMPSGLIAHCRCRYADSYYLDNALASHANNLRAVVLKKLHATLHLGKAAEPRTRSEIEQLFNTLTHRNIQHMVGGLRPDMSNRERKAAFKAAEEEGMTVDQMEEYLDVVFCRLNAHPTSAHYAKSPLRYLAEEPSWALVRTDDSERASWRDLLEIEVAVPVRASQGHPPHINYLGASYTNDLLKVAEHLVDDDIIITVNLAELLSVDAHLLDGTSLGRLTVLGEWQHFHHDFRLRKKLNQAINDGRFHWVPVICPEEAVARFLSKPHRPHSQTSRSSSRSVDESRPSSPSRLVADIAKSMQLDLQALLGDKLKE